MPDSLVNRIGSSLPAIVIGAALVVVIWVMPDLTPGHVAN